MHCSIIKYLCFCVLAVYCSATNSFAACIDDLPMDPVQNQILESALIEKPLSPVTEWLIQRYIQMHGNNELMTPIATLPQKADFVTISPDNSKLIAVSGATATIYKMSDLAPICVLSGHMNDISSIAISPDSTKVVTLSRDDTAKIWKIADGSLIRSVPSKSFLHNFVFISPEGSKFITHGRDATIWNLADGSFIGTFNDKQDGAICSAVITPDGLQIAAGFASGNIKLFNAFDGSFIKTLPDYHHGSANFIEINHNGSRMITGGNDGAVKIWNRVDDSVIATLPWRRECLVSMVTAASNDSYVITGYNNGTVRIWNKVDGSLCKTLDGGAEMTIRSIEINNDGAQFVTVAYDYVYSKQSLTKIWNMVDGSLITTIPGIWLGTISPDGSHLVTCDLNNTVKIWNMPLSSLFRTLKTTVKLDALPLLEWLHQVAGTGKKVNLKLNNPDPRVQRLMKYYRDQHEALPPLIKELVKDFVIV